MGRATFYSQFRELLLKNLKQQRLIILLEIFIPLIVIIIFILARSLPLTYNIDTCYLREKQMDSMGPIPFARDFLCTFNSTCYNKSQINWNNNDTNNFLNFLMNISKIHASFPKEKVNESSLVKWIVGNSERFETLNDSYTYWKRVSTPFWDNLRLALSDNQIKVREGIIGLSPLICGVDNNDIHILVDKFFVNGSFKSQPSNSSCRSILRNHLTKSVLGSKIFDMIVPILFGKIYYTPESNFTKEIMTKSNFSFVILDKLRLASIEWRLHFQGWLSRVLNSGENVNILRTFASECVSSKLEKVARMCFIIDDVLNKTTNNLMIEDLTSLFALIERVLNCVDLNKFVPLSSAADIDNLRADQTINVLAGIIFDPSLLYLRPNNATFLNYTIRIPSNRIDSTKRFKVLDTFWRPGPRARTLTDMTYYTSGFLMLQEAVDRAFVDTVAGHGSADIGSSMQIMPSLCYVDDRFMNLASYMMPFLLLLAWAPTFLSLVRSIVLEKERKLRGFMMTMGLSVSLLWLSYFVVAIATTALVNLAMTLLMKYNRIFEFSSPVVVFGLFFSYSVSTISQAFMCSVFFDDANVASMTSAIVYFLLYIPFVVLVNMLDDVTTVTYFLTGILSQVSFCNAIQLVIFKEQSKRGAQFDNPFQGTNINEDFGVGHCILMLWLDAAIYLAVTWYVDTVFPGKYGVARPWNFFATKRYWCTYKADCPRGYSPLLNRSTFGSNQGDHVPHDLEVGISIKNVTKIFPGNNIPAVDNLSLDFYKSQITAFLGHNGAGKTTTISMLTGMFPPSSGSAHVLGYDIGTSFDAVRHQIGICPQHSVLFDNLSVEDHIYFYGTLRGMSSTDIKSKLPIFLADVGLTKESQTQSKHLSGGMKRKLNVAMAFLGDSSVIFLDEPTAGVDPVDRRKIWDLIIKFRSPERAIVLTTHYLYEAEYLSDRIAIIARGKLARCGTSAFLKRRFGKLSNVTFTKTSSAQEENFSESRRSTSCEKNLVFIREHVPSALLKKETATQWTVAIPTADTQEEEFVKFLESLDESLNIRGISSYCISDPSLEEVFLGVSQDTQAANDNLGFVDECDGEAGSSTDHDVLSGHALGRQQLWALLLKRFHCNKRDIRGLLSELILPIFLIALLIVLLTSISPFDNEPSMVIHPWLMMPRTRRVDLHTFYRKEKVENIKVNKLTDTYRSDLGESGIRCMNKSVYSLKGLRCFPTDTKWSDSNRTVIRTQSATRDSKETGFQRCDHTMPGEPENSYRRMATTDILHNLTGYNISHHLINNYQTYSQKLYGGYQFVLSSQYAITSKYIGQSEMWKSLRDSVVISANSSSESEAVHFVDYFQTFNSLSGVRANFSRIWINNKGYVSMPAYANIFGNLLLRSQINGTNHCSTLGIAVSTHPLRHSKKAVQNKLSTKMYLELSVSYIVLLAFSLIPASFVVFLVEERVSGSCLLQRMSGVSTNVYWISNFLWDGMKYALSVLLTVLVFLVLNYESLVGGRNLVAFIVILSCYGLAIIPQMYLLSFLFSRPQTVLEFLFLYNVILGCSTLTITHFLDIVTNDNSSLTPLNDLFKVIFLLFPQYGLGRAVLGLAIRYRRYTISDGKSDYRPFDWDMSGKILTSFVTEFVLLSAIVFFIERKRSFCRKSVTLQRNADIPLLDNPRGKNVLKVTNLTKIYGSALSCICRGKRKIAVNDLSFDINAGESFGLLGVNGAGKTSTIEMLTGNGSLASGDAVINGVSITDNMAKAHRDLGFCPQFDSLHDLLTCEEELSLYSAIRGIKPSMLTATVHSSLRTLSLDSYTTKTIRTLSGGNKRKLSCAISLLASPKLIIFDEPTSGMDVDGSRYLWKRIHQVTNDGSAVLLTSHNMEECEELCDRLAFMVNGKLEPANRVQILNCHYVTLTMSASCVERGDVEDIKSKISVEFSDRLQVVWEISTMIQYRTVPSFNALGKLFRVLLDLRERNMILDHSIRKTSLDEIFIDLSEQTRLSNELGSNVTHDLSV